MDPQHCCDTQVLDLLSISDTDHTYQVLEFLIALAVD